MLKLAAPTTIREKLIKRYRRSMSLEAVEHTFQLLGDSLFSESDFAVIRTYVPVLKDVTEKEIKVALERNKAKKSYSAPNLTTLEPFFTVAQIHEFEELAGASEGTADKWNAEEVEHAAPDYNDETSKEEAIEVSIEKSF